LRKISGFLIVVLIFTSTITTLYSRTDRNYDKMISYFLLNDLRMAKSELKIFCNKYTNSQLKHSYSLLFENKMLDANDGFFNYLQMRPKSVEGLIGFALSDTRKTTAVITNLKKASRLDSNSSIALLCIANEYLKKLNYPKAAEYFELATANNSTIEFKIVHSFLYLKMNKPDEIIKLLEDEFTLNQTNFYVNYLLGSAYYLKNKFDEMRKYIDLLNGVEENKKKGDLLIAKYHISKRNFEKAKSILFQIKYKENNEDYDTALAITMMNLNSSNSLHYLYKAFNENKWNRTINKQLGIFFYKRGKKKMVQNFIYRSVLSGISSDKLKEYFSGIKFDIPVYKTQAFFQLFDVKWLNNDVIIAFARKNSGDKVALFVIDTVKNKIIKKINMPGSEKGTFNSAFGTKKGNVVFSVFNNKNNVMTLYALSKKKRRYNIGKIISINSYLHNDSIAPSILVGFDKTGTIAYITDGGIDKIAFQSPFLVKWKITNIKPVYPKYPFDIIKYDFSTKETFKILNTNQMKMVPIKSIRKYFLISQAYIGNDNIKSIITKGQKMDLISSDKVNTFFEDKLKAFLIYIKGSKNSFDAILFKNDNSVVKLSESMFLGEKILGETIDIQLFKLDVENNNIFLARKDTNQLINFNYKSLLYEYMLKNVKQLYYSKNEGVYYSIIDKDIIDGLKSFSMTVFSANPFFKLKVYKRNDILNVVTSDQTHDICFNTRNGEKLIIDDVTSKFKYMGPSFEDVTYSITDNKQKEAVFINGRLIIIENMKKIKKITNKKSKK